MKQHSSQTNSELLAWLALASAQRIAPKIWLQTLERYKFSPADLAGNASSLPDTVKQLTGQISKHLIDTAFAWLQTGDNRHIIPYSSSYYPQSLKQLDSPPLVLFATGDSALLRSPQIAIVGSRRASIQGKSIASEFALGLSNNGVAVTSGLAMGIDSAAHQGALLGNIGTVAVMGTGPEKIYPAKNRKLYEAINNDKGVTVTEFFPGQVGRVAFAGDFDFVAVDDERVARHLAQRCLRQAADGAGRRASEIDHRYSSRITATSWGWLSRRPAFVMRTKLALACSFSIVAEPVYPIVARTPPSNW